MTGHFTAYQAKTPYGAPAPTGSVLILVVDERTGQVTDWGLTAHRPPGLAELGTPERLPLPLDD